MWFFEDSLDRMAMAIHAVLFSLNMWIYFEWVQSDSNWSDGISRDGLRDQWHQERGSAAGTSEGYLMLLQLPFRAVSSTFEFL